MNEVKREIIEEALNSTVHIPLAYYNELLIKAEQYDAWVKAKEKAEEEFRKMLDERVKKDKTSDLTDAIKRYHSEFVDKLEAHITRKKEKTDDKETEAESENK